MGMQQRTRQGSPPQCPGDPPLLCSTPGQMAPPQSLGVITMTPEGSLSKLGCTAEQLLCGVRAVRLVMCASSRAAWHQECGVTLPWTPLLTPPNCNSRAASVTSVYELH